MAGTTTTSSSLTSKAVDAAAYVAGRVDPYVPQLAKDAIGYTSKTAKSTVDYASKKVSGTVEYARNTVTGTIDMAKAGVSAAHSYAAGKAGAAVEYGKIVVHGATTTITSYTPGPVVHLVTSTLEGAKALRQDPVGTIKPYVPTFVIHAGEKTYEIVSIAKDSTIKNMHATQGYIITKVNGTVKAVTSIPQVGALIEQLNRLTAPVLAKMGVTKPKAVTDAAASAATPMVVEDEEEVENQENQAVAA